MLLLVSPAADLTSRLHTSATRVRQRCGYLKACPVYYRAAEVNASAASWDASDASHQALLAKHHEAAKASCSTAHSERLSSGGWCLGAPMSFKALPRNESYGLPRHHKEADGIVVAALAALLSPARSAGAALAPLTGTEVPESSMASMPTVGMSLLDFGAGVGQYGHALRSLGHGDRWRGYDGAGNVEQAITGGLECWEGGRPHTQPSAILEAQQSTLSHASVGRRRGDSCVGST